MVGKIISPETTFVLSCKPLSKSADSDIVTREIDDAVHCLGIARDKFCLLLSDAARYMTTAGNLLKKIVPEAFSCDMYGAPHSQLRYESSSKLSCCR